MIKKHFWKMAAGVALLLLLGSFVISKQATEKANEGVSVETHIKGNPDAQVRLVEYSDFQCPACAQFFPYVEEIMNQYGDQIALEYRHFPLINIHPYAVPAAIAAEAAGQQGKFWEMHNKLFEEQSVWSRSNNREAYFIQYAEELGLDVDLFKQHLGSSVIADAVKASYQDAVAKGLRSTPTFFLNGEQMTYETFEDFVSLIEAAVGVQDGPEVEADAAISVTAGGGVEFGI